MATKLTCNRKEKKNSQIKWNKNTKWPQVFRLAIRLVEHSKQKVGLQSDIIHKRSQKVCCDVQSRFFEFAFETSGREIKSSQLLCWMNPNIEMVQFWPLIRWWFLVWSSDGGDSSRFGWIESNFLRFQRLMELLQQILWNFQVVKALDLG